MFLNLNLNLNFSFILSGGVVACCMFCMRRLVHAHVVRVVAHCAVFITQALAACARQGQIRNQ